MLPRAEHVSLDQPLKTMGFDSLMALELRNALARSAGVTLSATLVFRHPSIRAIASHLMEKAAESGKTSNPRSGTVAYGERLNDVSDPRARLFCFHEAGGSAANFVPFCQLLAAVLLFGFCFICWLRKVYSTKKGVGP